MKKTFPLKRGSGVKRLILLNFFRAKAEQRARERSNAPVIYAIEEPETSQHPHNQRLLVSALMDLAADNQVINYYPHAYAREDVADSCLRYIHQEANKSREVLCGGDGTNKLLAKSLGVLPDNSIKLFVRVEGKHDIVFLKNLLKVLRLAGVDVLDLEKMELDGELISSRLAVHLWRCGPPVLSHCPDLSFTSSTATASHQQWPSIKPRLI